MDSSCAMRLLLLLGLALGLAADTTMTPPAEPDVLIDLETDSLLVDQHFLTTLTTQTPHTQTTPREIIQSIEILPTESMVKEESAPVEDEGIPEEGSALGEDSGRVLRHSESDNSSSTTLAPEVGDRTTTVPHEDKDLVITVSLVDILPFWIDAGSGDHETTTTTATATMLPTEEGSAIGPAADVGEMPTEAEPAADLVTTLGPTVTEEILNEVREMPVEAEPAADLVTTLGPTVTEEILNEVIEMPVEAEPAAEPTAEPAAEPAADLVTTLGPTVTEEILNEVQPTADSVTTLAPSVIEATLAEVQHEGDTGTPKTGKINAPQVTEMPKGHVTPDWVIIVGFLVGVAALVLLCVAIATRDRWNSRSQFNQTGAGLQPADQQRALEMQTFLHEQQPKENGKAEEYTVIPLDELPETYSS